MARSSSVRAPSWCWSDADTRAIDSTHAITERSTEMAFKMSSEVSGHVVSMALVGELDATSAGVFKSEGDKALGQAPPSPVFQGKDLTLMASAGPRGLLYGQQKLGAGASPYLGAPQEAVPRPQRMSG